MSTAVDHALMLEMECSDKGVRAVMRSLRFSPLQAVRAEGVYANGRVTVRPLPEEVHGTSAERTLPLRRLEGGPVEQQELDEHLAKELLKVCKDLSLRHETFIALRLSVGARSLRCRSRGLSAVSATAELPNRQYMAGHACILFSRSIQHACRIRGKISPECSTISFGHASIIART